MIIRRMTDSAVERRLTAFLPDEEDLEQDNPIHANSVARKQGFKAALSPDPTLFGWTVPAVRRALGGGWLSDGWADVRYRRPVYPGGALTVRVAAADADGAHGVEMLNADGDPVVLGKVGLGPAPWYADLERPTTIDVKPPREPRLPLTPESIPIGEDLPARRLQLPSEEAAASALSVQGDDDPLWRAAGEPARIHPGWLARRGTETGRHTYVYGPSIQSRNQIQHLAPARPGEIGCAGHMADGYERKGHHYAVADVLVLGGGTAVTRLRYSVIYQLAS